jgi:hypothetical protein
MKPGESKMCKLMNVPLLILVVLTVPVATLAADPPSRPLDVTEGQFEYLCQLENQPEHSVVLDIHAAYKSEHEKRLELDLLINDITTAAYNIGFPATVAILMMAAAPL